MIHRLLIDNYRCFVNFECRPSDFQLILGDNGAGKTTLFDILVTLREFLVRGVLTKDAFPTNTLTAWDKARSRRLNSHSRATVATINTDL